MASRSQSIRTRIIALLTVPLVSLLALWSFAAFITLGDAQRLLNLRTLDIKLVRPTDTMLVALKDERRMSVAHLGGDETVDRSGFDAQRAKTDQARKAFLAVYRDPGLRNDVIGVETAERLDNFAENLKGLESLRNLVDRRAVTRDGALTSYTDLLNGAYAIYSSVTLPDAELASVGKTNILLNRALELINREDALITGALAVGRISAYEHAAFGRFVSTQRALHQDAIPGLPDPARKRMEDFLQSPDFTRFQLLEEQILRAPPTAGGRLPVDAGTWRLTTETAVSKLASVERVGYDELTVRANQIAGAVILRLTLAGGLGLLAVVASVVIATRASRKIIRENRVLATVVEEFGRDRLPRMAEAIRNNEHFDPEAGAPHFDFDVTEVEKTYRAFTEARRAVITATLREAAVRKGVSEVFVNLARRNQTLLHRQLSLLDNMERRVEDPDELEDLFRLDHLATRMRRHAEGLVILSGKPAGRSWRNPVPLVDVARGAVAEVEDYTRVRVLPMPRVALTGAAVADTIHLLAELIENATLFSPPDLPVQVSGQVVANGFALEIEDRGLGLTPEALAEANRQLENPPEFDPAETTRLGLFVVARLAHRHEVKVSLRVSPYGGTTAIVLIPATLIVDLPEEAAPQGIEPVAGPNMRPVPGPSGGGGKRSASGTWAATSTPDGAPDDFMAFTVPDGAVPISAAPAGPLGVYGPLYDDSHDAARPNGASDDQGEPAAGSGALSLNGSAGGPARRTDRPPEEERPEGLPEGMPFRKRRSGVVPQPRGEERLTDRAQADDRGTVNGHGSMNGRSVTDGRHLAGDPEGAPDRDTVADLGKIVGRSAGAEAAHEAATTGERPRPDGVGAGRRYADADADVNADTDDAATGAAAQGGSGVWVSGEWDVDRTGDGHPDLPRRTRQASLAPQLRDEGTFGRLGGDGADRRGDSGPRKVVAADGWEPVDEIESERPPEAVRSMMAAMQQGWKRGRADAEEAEIAAGPPVRSGTEEDG